MTILQLVSSEGLYGAENMMLALARSHSANGHRVLVGALRNSKNPHTEVADLAERQGLTAKRISCNGRWDPRAVQELRRLIQENGVDVVHTHNYKSDLFARAACWSLGVTLVATCHNWASQASIMRLYRGLDRLALRTFDRVATPSPVVADQLQRSGVAPAKLARIANGVDIEHFRHAAPTLREESALGGFVVGFVGRMVAEKGGATLLHAAQRVLVRRPEVTFVMAGDGPAKQDWMHLAARLGIAKQVIFPGVRTDMPGVYASFDLLALPSHLEAMPMCLLEAMAAGKPAVATQVGAVPELVKNQETGFLIGPNDPRALAARILQLVEDPVLAARFGSNALGRVRERFSLEAMSREYLSLYQGAQACRFARLGKPATRIV